MGTTFENDAYANNKVEKVKDKKVTKDKKLKKSKKQVKEKEKEPDKKEKQRNTMGANVENDDKDKDKIKFEKEFEKKIKKYKKQIKEKEDELEKKQKLWEKENLAVEAEATKAEEELDAVRSEIAKEEAKVPEVVGLSDKDLKKLKESDAVILYLKGLNKKTRNGTIQLKKDSDAMFESNKLLRQAAGQATFKEQSSSANVGQLDKYKRSSQVLKDDLRMRQGYYDAEASIRVNYQKSMKEILDLIQDRCDDPQLTEDILVFALECEAEANSDLAEVEASN
jgi:hypothetical protein